MLRPFFFFPLESRPWLTFPNLAPRPSLLTLQLFTLHSPLSVRTSPDAASVLPRIASGIPPSENPQR
jgi:hypothetical protein